MRLHLYKRFRTVTVNKHSPNNSYFKNNPFQTHFWHFFFKNIDTPVFLMPFYLGNIFSLQMCYGLRTSMDSFTFLCQSQEKLWSGKGLPYKTTNHLCLPFSLLLVYLLQSLGFLMLPLFCWRTPAYTAPKPVFQTWTFLSILPNTKI